MESPKRHLELTLTLGADNAREVFNALRWLEFEFGSRQEEIDAHGLQITTGGVGYGGNVSVVVNADVTHDSYFAAIDEWLAQERGATTSQANDNG